jgi:hypothetical protein
MARCDSKGKRAFYLKTSLLKPVYDLVEFSFKLPLERSVPVIFSSLLPTCYFGLISGRFGKLKVARKSAPPANLLGKGPAEEVAVSIILFYFAV